MTAGHLYTVIWAIWRNGDLNGQMNANYVNRSSK